MPHDAENRKPLTRLHIQNYLKDLTHYSKTVREVAKQQLRLHGADSVDILLEEYEKEFQQYSKQQLPLGMLGKIGVKFGLILGLAPFFFHSVDPYGALTFLWFLIISLVIGGSLLLQMYAATVPTRLNEIYQVLSGISDPRIFSTILEMYSINSSSYLENTLELLTNYLPQVTPSQWEMLSLKQRKALYHLMENRGQIATKRCYEFTLAALKALEQFGGAEAIPTAEYLAKHGSNQELRRAAQECLPYLETRRDEQSIRQTLLRASQSDSGKEELLRVPTHAPDMGSEQLLRMPREAD